MKRILCLAVAVAALLSMPHAHAQFSAITSGPSKTSTCTDQPSLHFDKQNNVVSSCGSAYTLQTQQTTIAVYNAQTALSSVTTAQNLFSLPLNAGFQNIVPRTLMICGAGIYTTPGTTAPTMTIQLVEGGITPVAITTAALSTTASTNMPFNFCFWIVTASTGSSGTLEAHGNLNANISANTPAAAAATYNDTNTAVSSAINLTAANTLALQVSASSTITSVQLRYATVEVVW
jgi:hypothetical protein